MPGRPAADHYRRAACATDYSSDDETRNRARGIPRRISVTRRVTRGWCIAIACRQALAVTRRCSGGIAVAVPGSGRGRGR